MRVEKEHGLFNGIDGGRSVVIKMGNRQSSTQLMSLTHYCFNIAYETSVGGLYFFQRLVLQVQTVVAIVSFPLSFAPPIPSSSSFYFLHFLF